MRPTAFAALATLQMIHLLIALCTGLDPSQTQPSTPYTQQLFPPSTAHTCE